MGNPRQNNLIYVLEQQIKRFAMKWRMTGQGLPNFTGTNL